ncbi:MAG: DUF927 domain-containing protein [Candidatus Nitricoxidivorans perseverans]|uniref:DUF927 domain-containing protein n=1 Tax=Candidatus Nitricoxidivorans perseverans TaxID=2975601 RepID=A0AA49IY46_9PROT|nr:MAG: DUF927 domain-containing protein [Candidatus Nitricoxidivorans perseverans]
MTQAMNEARQATADFQEAERYLNALGADADTVMNFRAIWPKEREPALNTRNLTGTFRELQAKLEQLNRQGFGIFVTINAGGTKASEINHIRAIFADFDDPEEGKPDPRPQDVINGLTPTMVVQSSAAHKVHVYYRVTDCPVDIAKPIQQAIVNQYGADDNAKDIARVLRVPGFWHTKAEPVMVRIISQTEAIYSHQQIIDALGLDISAKRKRTKGKVASEANEGVMALIKGMGNNVKPVVDVDQLRVALSFLSPDEYGKWVDYGLAIKSDLGDEGYPIWLEWSRTSDKFNEDAARDKWDNDLEPNGSITVATIFHNAKEAKKAGQAPVTGADGTVKVDKFLRDDNNNIVCNAITVEAITRDEHNENFGKLLVWHDPLDKRHRKAFADADILSGEVVKDLASGGIGLRYGKGAENYLLHTLTNTKPDKHVLCVERLGWQRTQAGDCFVMPDRTIGNQGDEEVVIQNRLVRGLGVEDAGTIEEWQEGIGRYCKDNSRLILSVCVMLSGPTLYPLGADNVGANLRGQSSSGKTTALLVGASVYGGDGFIKSWRSTDNGMEANAALRNDLGYPADELGQANPKILGQSIYMMLNGVPKDRATQTGAARIGQRWRVPLLSSSEKSVAEMLAGHGEKVTAGIEVRLIDVPALPDGGYGIFESLHDAGSGAALSNILKRNTARFHGVLGRMFIENLVSLGGGDVLKIGKLVRDRADKFANKLTEGIKDSDGQVKRVAQTFGIFWAAGMLASVEFKLTGWSNEDVTKALTTCFKAWLKARGGSGAHEHKSAVEQVKAFLHAHGMSRFQRIHRNKTADADVDLVSQDTIYNRVGWRRDEDDGGTHYYITPEIFKTEVVVGLNIQAAELALIEAKIMRARDDNGKLHKVRIGGDQPRLYDLTVPNDD